MIVEKPFGRDLESSRELTRGLAEALTEEQIYRIDHYLGAAPRRLRPISDSTLALPSLGLKQAAAVVGRRQGADRKPAGVTALQLGVPAAVEPELYPQRAGALRGRLATPPRGAGVVSCRPLLLRQHAGAQIIFSENFGTEGRGGYFDNYGIIRDIMQNHLLQVLPPPDGSRSKGAVARVPVTAGLPAPSCAGAGHSCNGGPGEPERGGHSQREGKGAAFHPANQHRGRGPGPVQGAQFQWGADQGVPGGPHCAGRQPVPHICGDSVPH